MTLPCIACGKKLGDALGGEDEDRNQPYGGTSFTSHGHYGSTVFDPMINIAKSASSRYLVLNVCDECLVEAAKTGLVLLGTSRSKSEYTLGPWDPEKEQ